MKRYSGHIAVEPAMAASTCSQIPNSEQMRPISVKGSRGVLEVVPTVAQTKAGVKPSFLSCSIALRSSEGHMANILSTAINRRLCLPIPAIFTAFSTEE